LIHVMYLVEFQSRVLVFIQWAIQDLTFNRGARLITGKAPTDFSFEEAVAASARNRPSPGEDRGKVAAATVRATTPLPDPSTSSGRLTAFGLLAIGAFPVLGFCLWLLLSVGRHVPVAGGGNVPSIFSPASGHAKSLMDLSFFVFAVTGTIFAVVFGLLANALLRYRKSSLREPPQVYGSSRIEVAWTIIPVLIVLVLFLSTARVIHAVQDALRPAGALDVTVVGHQFWWEFRYPSLGIVTANELHVPVSDPAHPRPTYLKLLSADTDHSFWVPELAGKTDLVPNRVNGTWIDPHTTGLFLGQCAQYCGTQHGKMLLRVFVDSPEDFDAWARAQRQPAVRDEQAAAGRRVFETTACINCHAVGDTVATGQYGPDLTHLMSRSTIASGAAENTGENLRRWIDKPDSIKPGSLMPAMKLADGDLKALVAYMQTLR
jgi:cytochrome c oxidase subunit II